MPVTVLGVRHHGPGSARAVAAALRELAPDAVLIEGPPEADDLLALAGDPSMRPPVALLAYATDDPSRAAFYPFAVFSPEWVAIRHAVAEGVTVRMIDLPAAHGLALDADEEAIGAGAGDADAEGEGQADGTGGLGDGAGEGRGGRDESGRSDADDPGTDTADHDASSADGDAPHRVGPQHEDPLGDLARAAGHDDAERWWEDVVEHRRGALDVFAAVSEAMGALREGTAPRPREARREAAMRRAIRRAEKDGHARIAVVCGAWHAPVLERATFPSAKSDDDLLRGLPRRRVATTWVAWTHDRLAAHTGYGAGVDSPGWYHHLFTAPDRPVVRWMQRVARVLREDGLDASPASVVEAVRLADALGAVRARPLPGLSEVSDAALAVLAQGQELVLGLIERRLVVGEALGEVPASTPMVPLVEDLTSQQRRLRMKPEALERERALDLRKRNDLDRSRLLHRLALLGVPWGRPARSDVRTTGTFRETWSIAWQPEFAVGLIEASRYGTTVEAAATGAALSRAAASEDLAELGGLVEACLLAALPEAISGVMRAVADRAAVDGDVVRLMGALEPLVRAHRYGSVRGEDAAALGPVVSGLVQRILAALPAASTGLDDDAARALADGVVVCDRALGLLERDELRDDWHRGLGSIAGRDDVHGLVTGRASRLLLDAGRLDGDAARLRMERELSRPADAERAAAWIEGFLTGSGLVLLHDPRLLGIIDTWVTGVSGTVFDDVLPVLRRSFGAFESGELRQLGRHVRDLAPQAGRSTSRGPATDDDLDDARATPALSTLAELLGLETA